MNPFTRSAIRRAGLLAGWAGLLLAGAAGCQNAPPTQVEQQREEHRQSRREAELNAEIETLRAKLDRERVKSTQDQRLADQLTQELTRERNSRRQEKLQLETAVQLHADLTKKLEDTTRQLEQTKSQLDELRKQDDLVINQLRNDLLRHAEMLKDREAEVAKLREGTKTGNRE
jgi:chromosome segregation ATPase